MTLLEQIYFWVTTDQLRTTDLVYCEGWECDFSHGERTSGGREKEREQLPGSGRSWHHHLWAPRVALGARQSQPVPGRLKAIQPEQIHCTLHHQNDNTKRQAITRPYSTAQNCRLNLVFVCAVLHSTIRGQNKYRNQWF